MEPLKKTILGVPTLAVTREEAIAMLDRRTRERSPVRVTFLNAHTAVMAVHDKGFRAALQDFVVFNDGIGIDIARWLTYGDIFSENLNGTDFIPFYLEKTANRFRIFLLGARAGVVEKTAREFAALYPRHTVVGFHDGYAPRGDALLARIREAQADMILVAMGHPLQELWIADTFDKTGAVVAFGVGGFFDFAAGRVPRAPRLLRRLRCEWLYRLYREPGRLWKRYTIENAQFLVYAVRDAVKYRFF